MKKVTTLVLMTVMSLSLTSCEESSSVVTNAPSVVASSSFVEPTSPASEISSMPNARSTNVSDMSAMDIVLKLQETGLPIDNIVEYDEETDPNGNLGRPNQYIQKVNFADTRLEQSDANSPQGGTVEIFNNAEDAQARYDYVDEIGRQYSALGYYLYLYDNILLRVVYDLTPTQAEEYQAAFEALTQQ
ncbi:hypothetical protein LJC49_03085 [Ruminococcaceae bacterium OttesenSCG-928-I18]|nr:hypothetical protein [Ruminococcaceae bacterium OttesenSCG-928-I18]